MNEYSPQHRAEGEPDEPRTAANLDVFLNSLGYESLRAALLKVRGQSEQESRGGGRSIELQMADIALAYPDLFQLIADMSKIPQEQGKHNAEVIAFAEGVEAGAVTLLSILKFYIDIEKLERLLDP